ncbi:MAG: radical SAM protein [Lachnospiraceae bacterium]|nr:radical SAM protein [Lachnospiraceae bacterium]
MLDMTNCTLCPRQCNVNRTLNPSGFCKSSSVTRAALASVHHFEEPSISGTKGSGTVFFSGCNMRCVFCQNFNISQDNIGITLSIENLADTFIAQQNKGVHNLNLVSAAQYLSQVKQALILAKEKGLTIPVVYNSNGYERVEALKCLDGLVDVYLPDIKYFDNSLAEEYSFAPNYFEIATNAVLEMYRQTGINKFDKNGIITKGVIVRHLVLPWQKDDSKKILWWIKENLGDNVYVSLMSQYTPMYKAKGIKKLNRKITTYEYNSVIDYFFEIGLKNGYMQARTSAKSSYTPEFDLSGLKGV